MNAYEFRNSGQCKEPGGAHLHPRTLPPGVGVAGGGRRVRTNQGRTGGRETGRNVARGLRDLEGELEEGLDNLYLPRYLQGRTTQERGRHTERIVDL